MKYYTFTLRYSQTDWEEVIVQANSKEEALARAKRVGARYVEGGTEARMLK